MSESGARREVVSFARRGSRCNRSQKRAWREHSDAWVLDLGTDPVAAAAEAVELDWERVFGRRADVVCEVGPGNGEALVQAAQRRPEADFIAFEVFRPGVASILSRINRAGVGNVRVSMMDARVGLAMIVPDASLAEVWTFFPDPWPKRRHHKRRLVDERFARLVARKLVPGGRWRLATDWEPYAIAMRSAIGDILSREHDGWAPRPAERPVTKYEARGLAEGRRVFDLCYLARG